MFCGQCGGKLLPDSKFCKHCGNAVTVKPKQEIMEGVQETAAGLATATPPPKTEEKPPVKPNLQLAAPEPTTELPAVPERTTELPAVPERTTELPAVPEPTTELPAAPERTTELPAVPERTTELPAVTEPTTELPAVPERTTELPAVPERTTELPAVPEPTAELPAVPEPTTEFPAVPEPTTELPAVPETTVVLPVVPAVEPELPAEMPALHAVPSAPAVAAATTKRKFPHFLWILPLVSLVIAGAGVGADYFYQMTVNRAVDRMLQDGEKLAMDGKLADGLTKIEGALKKRPGHRVLLHDSTVIKDALALEKQITGTDKQVQSQEFGDALKEIKSVQKDLKTRSGPLYDRLVEQAGKHEETIIVTQAGHEFPSKKTIPELIPLFHSIQDYKSDEAKKTAKSISQKVADLSYEKASTELEAKKFADALTTVEDALKLDDANDKLNKLRTTIDERKKAFEQAESQRIQQAINAATREETLNKTQAVELVSVDAYIDSNGYFVVNGTVKNIATRPISFVNVYFDMLDDYGNVINSGSVYATPNTLAVGETGAFYNYYYTDGSLKSVNVTSFEWNIN